MAWGSNSVAPKEWGMGWCDPLIIHVLNTRKTLLALASLTLRYSFLHQVTQNLYEQPRIYVRDVTFVRVLEYALTIMSVMEYGVEEHKRAFDYLRTKRMLEAGKA